MDPVHSARPESVGLGRILTPMFHPSTFSGNLNICLPGFVRCQMHSPFVLSVPDREVNASALRIIAVVTAHLSLFSMALTAGDVFGLLAVIIMLFPAVIFVVRRLHRCYRNRNDGLVALEPHRGMPVLPQSPSSSHCQQAFHDLEIQLEHGYALQPSYSVSFH